MAQEHIIVHEKIADGLFAGGQEIAQVDSLEQVVQYYEQKLKQPLAYQVKENRQKALLMMKDMIGRVEDSDAIRGDDMGKILDPMNTEMFNKFYAIPEGRQITLSPGLTKVDTRSLFPWPNAWSVNLFEHKDFGGRKYSLDCMSTIVASDTSLIDNYFDNIASSIEKGSLVQLAVCAEFTHFRGRRWYFWQSDVNLADDGCNNRISSIAATAVSVPALFAFLSIYP